MERFGVKATTVERTGTGRFTAVVSPARLDGGDTVDPRGLMAAFQKWTALGKRIPLSWLGSGAAQHQIGAIDPSSARLARDKVVADGEIDIGTPAGAEAWRMVKANALKFDVGHLVTDSSQRPNGGQHIRELDVISVVAVPASGNGDSSVVVDRNSAHPWARTGWPPLDSVDFSKSEALAEAKAISRTHSPIRVLRFEAS